ncbi:hypothetical protein Ple7327_1720 [Pleurocapsa sp. PCC 7327]|nr:hypothetical protein Ple7327_1720 [Pleurocapsa sp. PCC 7327]
MFDIQINSLFKELHLANDIAITPFNSILDRFWGFKNKDIYYWLELFKIFSSHFFNFPDFKNQGKWLTHFLF